MTDVASKKLIDEYVDIKNTDNGEYYFKIDQKLLDEYLEKINEAYHNGYYFNPEPEEDEDRPEFVYDEDDLYISKEKIEEWFKTENYNPYLMKMIKAEIASSYPKLSDYDGEEGSEDEQGNKKDKDGNYVAQGVVQIQRTKMNTDGTTEAPILLKYLPYDEEKEEGEGEEENTTEPEAPVTIGDDEEPKTFKQLIKAQSPRALDYFSFDESGIIYYATYTETIVTLDGVETEHTYAIHENPISYKAITSMCSMPYNFLFSLLQKSQNPEYLMKVVDLLLQDTELVLMIQDQLEVRINEEDTDQVERTVTQTATKSTEVVRGRDGQATIRETWSIGSVDVSYDFPAGDKDVSIVTTYSNTANAYLKTAKTWCMDFEQTATLDITNSEEDQTFDYTEEEYEACSYPDSNKILDTERESGSTKYIIRQYLSEEKLLSYTKTTIHNYIWNLSTGNKQINHERFLGLWQNDTGEYYPGCLFKEDGKKVGYALPGDDVKSYPSDVIPSENGDNIDLLLMLLRRHNDTEMHEQLMMYFWNKFTGEEHYDVNVDGILDYFNTNIISIAISGTASSNYIKAWEGGHLTADGKNYIVYEDGSAGHNNVAFGMATFITNADRKIEQHPLYGWGYYNHADIFAKYGIDVRTLKTGDLVPVDIVESAYAEVLKKFQDKVESTLSRHGIILSQNQIDALVNVCYKYGNINSFPEAYFNSLDANGNVNPELIRRNYAPFNYSSTVNDRKYANWLLFTEGKYIDRAGNEIISIGGTFLECAKMIHDYMAQNMYVYYTQISQLASSFEASKSKRATCCATYISWALEEAGYPIRHVNGCGALESELRSIGWTKITSYSELMAGDIVFMDTNKKTASKIDHVQLYIGGGAWYNAGNTADIQRFEPKVSNCSGVFTYAYRAPN